MFPHQSGNSKFFLQNYLQQSNCHDKVIAQFIFHVKKMIIESGCFY